MIAEDLIVRIAMERVAAVFATRSIAIARFAAEATAMYKRDERRRRHASWQARRRA